MTLKHLALGSLVALIAALASSGLAHAAPTLGINMTHSPTTIAKNDLGYSYTLGVRNTASTAPSVGESLFCNGIETTPGLPKNWFPGNPGDPTHPSYSFEWLRNGEAIAGATAQTYVLAAGDEGKVVQCLVRGTNVAASVAYVSLPAPAVNPQPATEPPSGTARPAIAPSSGTAMRTCTAPASWTGSPGFSFQWLRNGQPIAGATGATYLPITGVGGADEGKVLQCQVTATNGGGALVGISSNSTVNVTGVPNAAEAQNPNVQFGNSTTGTVTAELELPPKTLVYNVSGTGWTCLAATPGQVAVNAVATCTRSNALAPQTAYPDIAVKVSVVGDAPNPATATATVSGGGAAVASVQDVLSFAPRIPFGITPNTFLARALAQDGSDYTPAGGHPARAVSEFTLNTVQGSFSNAGGFANVADVRDIVTDLPEGFVGNPEVSSARCSDSDIEADRFGAPTCPRASMVGSVDVDTTVTGLAPDNVLYAVKPDRGVPAQFMFVLPTGVTLIPIVLAARLRPEGGGYAVSIDTPRGPKGVGLRTAKVTLCSFGVNLKEDTGNVPFDTPAVSGCKLPSDPGAFAEPFLTNPTTCSSTPPVTRLSVSSWAEPDVFDTAAAVAPLVTGCDQVPFTPDVKVSPSSTSADGPAGVDAEISIPTDGLLNPNKIAQSHLKKAVVEMPEGVSVNPSTAAGLVACSHAQLGLGTNDPVSCPAGSKIGTVEVTTPLLKEKLTGEVVLRSPASTDPESGEMLRMAIVARSTERGILVKLPGSATADAETGRLVATFDQNPQVPFSDLEVRFKRGQRGVLAMPQDCGEISTTATLSPWSGNSPAVSDTAIDVDGDCSLGFAPKVEAGSSTSKARASGEFSFRFSRQDGEQWVDGLTASLPRGLLASVKDVPLCSSTDADAGSCPVGSRIGTVDATAGSGDPFVLERKGDAYLTVGYKGCPYGLAVKVPVIAGPFDASSPTTDLGDIVVRQKVCVDRSSAQVSVTSDPLPTIWHGIPLRVRSVTVRVDQPGFMLNPSDCSAKQVAGSFHSARGATSDAATPFQTSGCASLPFKPKLSLALTGKRQVTTGTHPGVRAVVRQAGVPEAGIDKAVVRLPKSLALDPNNAQALCEFADGTRPDLENHCPAGSIVGRARAKTPLLKDDLVGNVYFVKNVRRDANTGNEIRTLPMIVVALRGEIAVNLKGESSTTKSGKLVNTFANVPDAPISQFSLNIKGGKTGILAVTRTRKAKINLCAGRHVAEADTDGHNGRRHDFDIRMKTPCPKVTRKSRKARSS